MFLYALSSFMPAVSTRNLYISKLIHALHLSIFKMKTHYLWNDIPTVKLEKKSNMLYKGSLSFFPQSTAELQLLLLEFLTCPSFK